MLIRKNCWEYMKCGREEGGKNIKEHGLCPAASVNSSNMINGGKNGGRVCWAIAGTFNPGRIHCTFAKKHRSCLKCKFFIKVRSEEEPWGFVYTNMSHFIDTEEED